MRQELMKKTTICCICFFVIAMGIIIYLSVHKVVTIEGVAQDEVAGETIATGNESHALGDAEVPLGLPGFAAAGALVQGHIVGRRELRVELGL